MPDGSPILFETTPTDAGRRLDHFLQEHLPDYSRSRLQDWIRQGRVLVAGRVVKPSYLLRAGEALRVEPAAPPSLAAVPEDIPLDILYEDEDLVAVNKPAGMVVHAGAGRHSGTLVNAVLHRFESLSGVGGRERPGIVHRLDRDTSGVILVARTDAAHRSLATQFAARKVRKIYLAMVHGWLRDDAGRIDQPVGRDPIRRTRMSIHAGGRPAVTEYRVLRRIDAKTSAVPGAAEAAAQSGAPLLRGPLTYLEVRILTGRTHQIRVHMAGAGHPVVGDRLYGAPGATIRRLFLHAWQLTVSSPSRSVPLHFQAPLPEDLKALLAQLEGDAGTA